MKASSNQPLVAASGFIWEDGLQDSLFFLIVQIVTVAFNTPLSTSETAEQITSFNTDVDFGCVFRFSYQVVLFLYDYFC